MTSASVPARPTYRIRAQSVEACNCALGCNCYFGGTPNEGICGREGASPEQVSALVTILSGQTGGMPWEAIAGTIETFEGPILRPIEIGTAGRRGHVRVAGPVELETKPIRNPLAGDQEIEVHMVYPKGGILWNDGNIVTTSTMRVTHDSLRLEWPDKFSVLAEVTWTNAA